MADRYGRAVVIGGSIAGLLAARVLSEHFEEVTIVERHRLAGDAEPRQAIPHGRHVHVLLQAGIQIVDQLFPGLVPDLVDAGLVMADMGRDLRWRHFGLWKTSFSSGINLLFVNRPLFEWQMASRLLEGPNIKVIQQCEVAGLMASRIGDRISGVSLRRTSGLEERHEADLVIDASGRGSRTPQWLSQLGLELPEETAVEVKVGYASRTYKRPGKLPGWTGLFVVPRPPARRGGAIFPIDGNRWMVTLAGWLGDYPPANDQEYLEFAGSLEVPDVRASLERAEPLSPIVIHKFPSNLRRHYERLPRLPESLIVLGDALCSFNPVYGQGMTVAALEAVTLDRCLENDRRMSPGLRSLSRRFHRLASRVVDAPWQLAVGEDLRYPGVEGRRPAGTSLLHWYTGLVHRATARDEHVARKFYEVVHLLQPPPMLFHPSILARAATRSILT